MTRRVDEHDARPFAPGFGGLEALLDAELPLQTQHAPQRGALQALCGSYDGQVSGLGTGVTCPLCKAIQAKRKARRGR